MAERMRTVSFKVPPELDEALDNLARARGTTRSELVRQALEALAKAAGNLPSVTAEAGGLVGSVAGPPDLATNPKHMAGYGK